MAIINVLTATSWARNMYIRSADSSSAGIRAHSAGMAAAEIGQAANEIVHSGTR